MGKKSSGSSAAKAQAASNAQAQAEIRRQFDITSRNIKPFLDAGAEQLPTLQERTSVDGLDSILAEIFGSENFQTLRDERQLSAQNQLAAGGLTRSGTALQEAARVPTDLGFQIEQLLTGRSQDLAYKGQNAAAQLGSFGDSASGGIAGLSQNTGQGFANGQLADQQARQQGFSNVVGAAATIGSIFFSDPSLKENVEEISKIGPLGVYQWDWKKSTEGTLLDGCGTVGFMADEVEALYPQFVFNFGGFMMIDYPALLDHLDEKSAEMLAKLEGDEDAKSTQH